MGNDFAPIIAAIARVVHLATRYAWLVIPGFLIATVLAVGYVSRHIAINTDSDKLLSSSLPWRQQEEKLDQLFPQGPTGSSRSSTRRRRRRLTRPPPRWPTR